MQQTA